MKKFLLAFLTTYLFPILKEAVAQAVVHQIEDAVYGPRSRRRGYIRGYGDYRGPRAVPDQD